METPFRLAPRGCAACPQKNGLLCCSGCKVVYYCNKEHQLEHRAAHKSACIAIKKTWEALQREEAALRANPGDGFMMPADVFNSAVGQFWGILGTRDYLRARFAAADALLKINNVDAVEKALGHFTDMLRLCRSDNLGVRDIVPFLLLRLGREQECYDSLKWWATHGAEGDASQPFFNVRNSDAFEPVDAFRGAEFSHLVALTLLKLRLYLDLGAYDADPASCDRPIGKLVRVKVGSIDRARVAAMTEALKDQYLKLVQAVQDANPHFWPALVDEDAKPTPPPYYSPGSPEEADLVLHQCKRAWDESEDAVLMIDADTAKFIRVYPGSTSMTDASASPATANNAGPSRVLMLCLEWERMFDDVHADLVSRITSKADSVQRATTAEEAIAKLNSNPPPSVILVADGAITRQRKLRERVIDLLRGGATVLLAGCFSSMVNRGELERLLATLGLPWKRGSYHRETVKLCLRAVDNRVAEQLPSSYSQKALFLKNVDESAIWYAGGEASSEAAVAFAKLGEGRLGYIGDVNGEDGSVAVVLAMCGL